MSKIKDKAILEKFEELYKKTGLWPIAENSGPYVTRTVDALFKRKGDRTFKRVKSVYMQWLSSRVEEPLPEPPVLQGTIEPLEDVRMVAVAKTFILTCAQANTILHDKFWDTLQHIVNAKGAELHISRFTYNKQTHGKNSVKPGTEDADDGLWFDPRIEPYVSDSSLELAPDLVWCGELNILPTRANPITGFEAYGRGKSVIIPHTRMAMKTVPTMKTDQDRFCYSTGTVTARNYIEKAAGQKASLHHVYGALLVEVDDNGVWWARQLNSDNNGHVYDLDTLYTPEGIDPARQRAKVITHGDIHGNKVDPAAILVAIDVVDFLRPENQVFHDTVDFQPRNHHNIDDPQHLYRMHIEDTESVEEEFEVVGKMLAENFDGCSSNNWIITSNHDQAIEGWLRNTSAFYDSVNVKLWLELNLGVFKAIQMGEKPRPFAWLMQDYLPIEGWCIVHEDESLKIAGIEHGLHGHLGPNGARGTPANLRVAGKANTAHTHTAGIIDGVYTAGVYGKLDMGYNKGQSSWTPSCIVTYPNGKRTILTFKAGKAWRDK